MSSEALHATPDDEGIAVLIETNPAQAERLLAEMGYSVEEWKRARNAPPAVEHGRNVAGAPPEPAG